MVLFLCCVIAIFFIDVLLKQEILLFAWDLFLSGFSLLIIGILLAMGVRGKFEDTVIRLVNRGVIQMTEGEIQDLLSDIEARSNIWTRRSGYIVAIAILLAFIVAGGVMNWVFQTPISGTDILAHVPLVILEVYGGYIAGYYLGLMALYGTFGWILKNRGIPIQAQPGHVDEVAGFRPLGEFYFFQAIITALPAIFLAGWLLIMLFRPGDTYNAWQKPYLGLLPLAIAFEIIAFLAPIWYFHQEMGKQKADLVKDADLLSKKITALRKQLIDIQNAQQYDFMKDQLSFMTRQYLDIEDMPIWPVTTKIRRRFTIGNLALFSPVLGNFLDRLFR
jgi:hypothetical protein